MINEKYNEEYEIVCSTNDWKKFENDMNVRFVSQVMGIFHFFSSKHIYYCFGRIPIIPSKDQIAVQMWHGTSFKGFDKAMQETNSLKKQFYSLVFASSSLFIPIVSKKFSVPTEKVFLCGHPRTDIFFVDNNEIYEFGDTTKLITWLPTFRNSKKMGYSDVDDPKTIPIFKDESELDKLDIFLNNYKVKLFIKLHPMQDYREGEFPHYKNIIVFSHDNFLDENLDLYRLLKQSDALITDYSSVFYDFLLLNRPIGFTEDDIGEYGSNRGFAISDPDWFRPGMKLRDSDDFYKFVMTVVKETDNYENHRNEVNKLVNKFKTDNCKRALSASNIKLRKKHDDEK